MEPRTPWMQSKQAVGSDMVSSTQSAHCIMPSVMDVPHVIHYRSGRFNV